MLSINSVSQTVKATSPLLLLLLCPAIKAQITLPTLTGCVGNPTGTATFSTDMSIATGSERIPAADFWNQGGAVWIFSTDTEGVEFSQPGIPGYGAGFGGGGPPAAAESALKLDPSKTAWTLSVPTSSLGGEWDINFEASASTALTTASSIPPATTTPAAAAKVKRYEPARPIEARVEDAPASKITSKPGNPQKRTPVGAKFRRQAASGQFHLVISGEVPCLSPAASKTASGNAAIASSCINNEISTATAVWSTYGVQSYTSSLLQAAAPAPTDPQVNGASLIHSDVNPAGAMCTYTAQCAGVSCNGVKDDTTGSVVSVQRYLAWNAVANLNNYLFSLYEALFNAGTLNGLLDGKIVTTYFTNPTPDATWEQIMNVFTPLLGIFSAMLGPFSGAGSAIFGIMGGIASSISAGGILGDLAPVVDKRFTEFATIEAFVGQYLNATVLGIESAYNSILGADASALTWAGSALGDTDLHKNGYFGLGNCVLPFHVCAPQNLDPRDIRI